MMRPKFSEIVGATGFAVALVAVAYLAVFGNNESAQGALYGVIGAAVGYFMRGKVERTS